MIDVCVINHWKICNDKDGLDKSGFVYLLMVAHGPDCKKNQQGLSQSTEAGFSVSVFQCHT